MIDFEAFADGTLITTELTPSGIALVSGSSPNIPGPTSHSLRRSRAADHATTNDSARLGV